MKPAIVKRRAANGSVVAGKAGRAREPPASRLKASKKVPKIEKEDGPAGVLAGKPKEREDQRSSKGLGKAKPAVARPKGANVAGTAGDLPDAPGKMKRRMAAVPKGGSEPDEAKPKKRRSSSAKASNAGTAFVPNADASMEEEVRAGRKRVACTLFVGQLPYHATAADIETHFLTVCQPPVRVRLLTHKGGGGSRGMAFVELGSESEVHSALRLHHSCIYGRRINVERTVGGGHMGAERERKLKELRSIQVRCVLVSFGAPCPAICLPVRPVIRPVRELVHSVLCSPSHFPGQIGPTAHVLLLRCSLPPGICLSLRALK
jgi:hypothetical protein